MTIEQILGIASKGLHDIYSGTKCHSKVKISIECMPSFNELKKLNMSSKD